MAFVALDEGFPEHPKVSDLHDRAFRFHVTALCYCTRNLTDGHVSAKAIKVIAAILETTPKRWPVELSDAGLWFEDEDHDGFWIKDYLVHNPSGADLKDLRDKRRVAGRKGAIARWQNEGKSQSKSDGKAHGSSHMPDKKREEENLRAVTSAEAADTPTERPSDFTPPQLREIA